MDRNNEDCKQNDKMENGKTKEKTMRKKTTLDASINPPGPRGASPKPGS